MHEPTPTQALATVLLGEEVLTWIADRRSATPQWSWRLLADELDKLTDGQVAVSGETLRQWMAALNPEPAA